MQPDYYDIYSIYPSIAVAFIWLMFDKLILRYIHYKKAFTRRYRNKVTRNSYPIIVNIS